MKIKYAPRFDRDIANQYAYGVEHFGKRIAAKTYRQTLRHVETVLANFPDKGRWSDEVGCRQSNVPKTPFIVFYRHDGDTLEILALFHNAQDMSGFKVSSG